MSSRETSLTSWLLASPPIEWAVKFARELLIGTLRQGPIPNHVAFVMDGNRRFAKERHIEAIEGHSLGFEALARVRPLVLGLGFATELTHSRSSRSVTSAV
jgi:ditrans,polycis-polyprenyl diphosphate synthase